MQERRPSARKIFSFERATRNSRNAGERKDEAMGGGGAAGGIGRAVGKRHGRTGGGGGAV